MRFLRTFLLCLAALSITGFHPPVKSSINTATPGYKTSVPAIAASPEYVPGQVLIRFKPDSLANLHLSTSPSGLVETGAASLDRLNRQWDVNGLAPLFAPQPSFASQGQTKTALSGIKATYRLLFSPAFEAAEVAASYRADPVVQYAEPNYIYHTTDTTPNDPFFAQQWSLKNTGQQGGVSGADLDAANAWNIETGISTTVIAVIDTGVDWQHADLAANIWTNRGEIPGNGLDDDGNGYIDDIRGWDFVTAPSFQIYPGEDGGPPDNNPMDFFGHGTLMAGVAAASSNNGLGIAGVCWKCSIMPVRAGFEDASGRGSLFLSDVAPAIVYAADEGARIISMSFGGGDDATMADAVEYAASKDVLMVASAGNDNTDFESYPAAYPVVLAVAATDRSDTRSVWGGQQASNFGSWVDLAAPGTAILSTSPNSTYTSVDGTSPAAPHVSGLAGLLFSKRPQFSAKQARTVLISSTDPVQSVEYIGAGRINAYQALLYTSVPTLEITSPAGGVLITGSITLQGTAGGPGFQSYTLESGSGNYPTSWNVITSSDQPVIGGSLGVWHPAGLPSGPTILRLKVTYGGGKVTFSQVRVLIDNSLKTGWPVKLSANAPILVDLNRDRSEEAVLTSVEGKVHVLDADGSELPGWPQSIGDNAIVSPAAADLEQNGSVDIVAASASSSLPNGIYAWHADGSPLPGWPRSLAQEVVNTPAIGDIDGDGKPEIITTSNADFSNDSRALVHVFEPDGHQMNGWPVSIPVTISGYTDYTSPLALGDLDGDGNPDIVFGTTNGWVHVLKSNGTELPGWPKQGSPDTLNAKLVSPVLGDVNADGKLEVVGVSLSYQVNVWKADGSLLPGWPVNTPGYALGQAALADLDGNGDLEIILHSNQDLVYAWDYTGLQIFGWPVNVRPQFGNPVWPQPIAVDLNGDGRSEVLAVSDERKVYGLNWDGTQFPGWPHYMMNLARVSGAVGDLDGDGKLELLAADTDRLYAWDLDTRGGSAQAAWAMYQHDAEHTGRYTAPLPPPVAGVALDPLARSSVGYPGDKISHSETITNTGNSLDSYDLKISGGSWPIQGPQVIENLEPGSSQVFTLTVTIPAEAAGTVNQVRVKVISQVDSTVTVEAVLTTQARSRLALPLIMR